MTTLSLRPLTLADAEPLQIACWPDASPILIADVLARTLALVQIGRTVALVANLDGQIVGYGQVTRWPHAAEISDLIVASEYRSQGIGSTLIAALIESARDWTVPVAEIGVALSNPRALALYERLGFGPGRIIEIDLGNGYEPVHYLIMPL